MKKEISATAERRKKVRFPIQEECTIRTGKRMAVSQTGLTVDINTHGVLIKTLGIQSSDIGKAAEVSVSWPVLLDGSVPIKLFLFGTILRVDGKKVAVRINRHEFWIARKKRPEVPVSAQPEPRTGISPEEIAKS